MNEWDKLIWFNKGWNDALAKMVNDSEENRVNELLEFNAQLMKLVTMLREEIDHLRGEK
jgi:hypothetical protein